MSTTPTTFAQSRTPSPASAPCPPCGRESADVEAPSVTDLVDTAMAASTANVIAALEDLLTVLRAGADSRAQLAQLPSEDLLRALSIHRPRLAPRSPVTR